MATKDVKFQGKTYKISYEIRNANFSEYILILHGWGASKDIMIKAFSRSFTKIKQIYVDLPGFGSSNMFGALNTKEYKKIINEFIKAIGNQPLIIMGHSFGGKVASLLNPQNLVLLSTAGIVEPKPFYIRAKIATYKVFKALGLGSFYSIFATKDVAGMSRAMYETLKNVVNEDFTEVFKKSESNTLIFWGENDTATNLKSGELIHKLIKNSQFYPLKGDHFFFLLHANFIAKTIEEKLLSQDFMPSVATSSKIGDLDDVCGVGEVYERDYFFKDDKISQQDRLNIEVEELKFEKADETSKDDFANKIDRAFEQVEQEVVTHEQKYKNLDSISEVGEVYERDYAPKEQDSTPNSESEAIKVENFNDKNTSNLENSELKQDVFNFKIDENFSNQKREKPAKKQGAKVKERSLFEDLDYEEFIGGIESKEVERIKFSKNIEFEPSLDEKIEAKFEEKKQILEENIDQGEFEDKFDETNFGETENEFETEFLDENLKEQNISENAMSQNQQNNELEVEKRVMKFSEIYEMRLRKAVESMKTQNPKER